MKRSKIIFLVIAILFLVIVMYFIYDFSRKTTFPGSNEKESNIEHTDSED